MCHVQVRLSHSDVEVLPLSCNAEFILIFFTHMSRGPHYSCLVNFKLLSNFTWLESGVSTSLAVLHTSEPSAQLHRESYPFHSPISQPWELAYGLFWSPRPHILWECTAGASLSQPLQLQCKGSSWG